MRLRNVKNADEIINNSKYIIADPTANKGKWHEFFKNDNPVHIEIGCGKGRYIYDLALVNPDINFIGIEKFDNVIVRACEKFEDYDLSNVYLMKLDASELENVFDKAEVSRIYLNFSDPWPKKKHAKRRLSSPNFLKIYARILGGVIEMKTDNLDLFEYSLESFLENDYEVLEKTYDLHSLNVFNIMTEYEEKFSKKGVKIKKLVAKAIIKGEE